MSVFPRWGLLMSNVACDSIVALSGFDCDYYHTQCRHILVNEYVNRSQRNPDADYVMVSLYKTLIKGKAPPLSSIYVTQE